MDVENRGSRRSATTESLVGLAAVVLSVLGLIGVMPAFLCAIAVICVGVAFMVGSGGALLGETGTTSAALTETKPGDATSSLGIEWSIALAAVVLGVLALLGVNRPLLLSISSIVLGSALILRSAALGRGLSASDLLVGLTAAVLGILALAGNVPVTLSLVAMLSLGSAALFTSASWAPRLLGGWSNRPARRSVPQA